MALHVIGLFAAGLLAHGRLAADRPHPSSLTEYFLLISFGGVLGGIFNALIAPVVFEVVLEYVIAIVLALLLRQGLAPVAPVATRRTDDRVASATPAGLGRFAWTLDYVVPLLLFVGTLVALVVAARHRERGRDADAGRARRSRLTLTVVLTFRRPIRYALAIGALLAMAVLVGKPALYTDRTFFGLNRVVVDEDGRHQLAHGTTIHGGQWTDASNARTSRSPTTTALDRSARCSSADRTPSAAGRTRGGHRTWCRVDGGLRWHAGQRMTFYEIDSSGRRHRLRSAALHVRRGHWRRGRRRAR